jgi:hypothetical protein
MSERNAVRPIQARARAQILLLASLSLATTITTGAESGYRALGAHVHGVGALNVALDGDTLLVELISPAMNLVGFEHPPRTAEQRAAVRAARAALEAPAALFVPNRAADCVLMASTVELDLSGSDEGAGADHGHEHQHQHSDHAAHQDAHAEYAYHCRHPESLDALEIGLFERFPGTEELRVQVITPRRQGAQALTADDDRLAL